MTAQPTGYDAALYDDDIDYGVEPIDLPSEEAEAFDLANWHLRVIGTLRSRREELVSNFEAEMARLQMRLDALLATIDSQIDWHERPLRNLHRAILERDPKRKTINLACGTLKATKQQDEWLYRTGDGEPDEMPEDATAFIEWAQAHRPELIAPVTIALAVDATALAHVEEQLQQMQAAAMLGFDVGPPTPAKLAVKQTLVKKDDKGKVLVAGVDPETSERPPGLIVRARDPKFDVITDPDS